MRPLFAVLALVVALKLGEQMFRYFAYRDERTMLGAMRERLLDAGAEVVRTRMRADSLRREIERADDKLSAGRGVIDRYGRYAEDGALPGYLYEAYRADLRRYNTRVAERNAQIRLYQQIVDRNRSVTQRYNSLADSMESVAVHMKDPFYPVPKPVEAAAERGVIRLPE